MEHINYLCGENTLSIDNQHETKKQVEEVKALFMSAEVTLNQLAEIIYNSYLRKHPEAIREGLLLNKQLENNPPLNKAA